MRILLALLALVFAGAAPALETARALADAGAPQLALARVERLQPSDNQAERWGDWEELRLRLLTALARHADALQRAAALSPGLPRPALRRCLLAAARAAIAGGQGAAARGYAARMLWTLEPTPDEVREVRLLVIESHLADRQGAHAFHAMLRYDQDHRPLDRGVAHRFVEQLLELGLDHEAVNWLSALDDQGALKLHLHLRAGLIEPKAAVADARARLNKAEDARYWAVLGEAAEKLGDGALHVEALERLLQGHAAGRPQPQAAAALWRAYSRAAEAAANEARLLAGEDAAWLDLAARQLDARAPRARALYAHLGHHAAAPAVRVRALSRLVELLERDRLPVAALHLFGHDRAPETLDTAARHRLGELAETHSAPALAVRFWQGLAAPAGTLAEEWPLRVAAALWRSGMRERALDTARAALKQTSALPEPAVSRAMTLARDIAIAGSPDSAEQVYAALLPGAGGARGRDILMALGGLAESRGRYAAAADYFLRAALANGPQSADALALNARAAAAVNLARAGHLEDARAQYEWLLARSKDPAQLETARRALARP